MGKPPTKSRAKLSASQVARLRRERQKLKKRLAALDSQISKNSAKAKRGQLTPEQVDRLFDELSEGLDHLPTLPADWSRADIYDDHD